MTKARFIQTLTLAREQWEGLLAQVGAERASVPAINGYWSIKDTVGHVNYYERWLLQWLEAAARGQIMLAPRRETIDVDERNAIIFRENRDRTWDDVLGESRLVFERLLLLVKLLPPSDMFETEQYARYVIPFWGSRMPLWKCVAENSYEHYEEHAASIRAWLSVAAPVVGIQTSV